MGIFDKHRENKTVSPEDRRNKNNQFIQKMGIACLESLPLLEAGADVKLKDLDTICRRAIACLLSIQLACDISDATQQETQGDYTESKELFSKLLKKYKVDDALLEKEKGLFEDKFKPQDVIDVAWTYEAYWSLVWALGLIPDIRMPDSICDCKRAITLVSSCNSYEKFKKQCRMRNVEEILDMLDLYYRYHWACEEKRINPNTEIGSLNPEVVMERRRGLEWLIAEEKDWNDISLDT